MKAIYPTHTCFDDALDMLCEAIKANPGAAWTDELKLVHGILLNPAGEPYSHAWVESFGDHVWFKGWINGELTQVVAQLKDYYIEMKVQETTKYTPLEAWKQNEKHVTYGPWEEKYLKLCRDKKGVK